MTRKSLAIATLLLAGCGKELRSELPPPSQTLPPNVREMLAQVNPDNCGKKDQEWKYADTRFVVDGPLRFERQGVTVELKCDGSTNRWRIQTINIQNPSLEQGDAVIAGYKKAK